VSDNIPQRTCVGCKKVFGQNELLAVTKLKNGQVVVNVGHKTAGRSVYLCYRESCLLKAKNRKGQNGLQYGLKSVINLNIWEELATLIKKP